MFVFTSLAAMMTAWHLWTLAGILLVILEMFTLSFYLASFGVACLLTAVPAAMGVSLNWQLGVFVVSSAILLFLIRPLFHKGVYRASDPRRTNAEALVGQVAIVVESIPGPPAVGRVKLGGEEWRAQAAHPGFTMPAGTQVQVTSVEGATLTVQPKA
jgi:membrane protein implicated in regulation of membrane protease activity